jgi:NAD(P)-dependent dehydrogenase (short-subunit alcohol dehydrogenase family)
MGMTDSSQTVKRVGTPEEVAKAAFLLASRWMGGVTRL